MGTGLSPRPLVAGNWKMNGLKDALREALTVNEALAPPDVASNAGAGPQVMICPPSTLVMVMAEVLRGGPLTVGAQDCHVEAAGANTGDISAEMLADAGAAAIIVGHSERRAGHGETDRIVLKKQQAVHRAGVASIVCAGETAGERSSGLTLEVVRRQLAGSLAGTSTADNTVVAYEPVWAIGTGLTPTAADISQVHAAIRAVLAERFGDEGRQMRILYGGSVKPANARELLSIDNVNGALVGGASLKAADFLGIIAAYA